ncbi:MAG: histidine kinase [Flavobacteriia bacterium]|jgi:sensor histidine kinase YesM
MKFVIAFLIGIISTLVFSQEPLAIAISKNQGLSSNTVYNILQDKKGFIWITTNDGLFRYDGFSFKPFANKNQSSLSGSALEEDAFGRIWYQNFDGFLFYTQKGKLKTLLNHKPVDYIPQGISKKHLFAACEEGIAVYDLQSLKRIKIFKLKNEFIQNTFVDSNKFYFIANSKIYCIDENLKQTLITNLPSEKTFWYLTKVKTGILLVSRNNSSKKIFCLKNGKLQTFADFNFKQEILAFKIIENRIWIFSANGVFIYACSNGKMQMVNHFLKGKKITNGIKDNTGKYWFSTLLEGAYLIPDLNRKLIYLADFKPLKLVKDGDGFLLGTKNHQLLSSNSDFSKIKVINEGSTNSDVYYIYKDHSNGNIFYSSNGANILIGGKSETNIPIHFAIKEVKKLDEKYYIFVASGLFGMYQNPLGKSGGLSTWDEVFFKNQDKVKPNFAPLMVGLRAKSLAFDKHRNRIYVATNKGLFKVNYKGNIKEIRLNGHSIYCQKLEFINNKLLALSSVGDLYEISENQKIKLINAKFDFNEKSIKQLTYINSHLILRSNSSVKVFESTKFKLITEVNISNFDVYDTYYDNVNFIILTDQGILSLSNNLNNFKHNSIPRLIINDVLVNNKVYKNFRDFNLKPSEDNVEINFSLLNYGNQNSNNLWYQLNNKKWVSIENNMRVLKFASLASGNYKIKFKWKDKVEHIYAEQINFTIQTPFYKEIWFLALCLFLTFALVYSYYRWQVSNLKNKNNLILEKMTLEKNLSKSMLTSIKSQMNPHFFYNALNTIQSYIFLNDKKNASNFLSKFSNLTRLILEMSDKETITLSEELKALHLYLDLEKMRFEEAFEFHFQIDKKIDCDLCRIPSMLIQPYIENAIKHGLLHKEGTKCLDIKFSLENQVLLVEIVDNGVGRKRAAELKHIKEIKHESFSTNANAKRLEILNKGLHLHVGFEIVDLFSENQASGTYVKLSIPIQ